MKKILFLIHDLGYGGAEKILVNLANNLNKSKYDVTVQTLFDVGVNRENLGKDVHYIGGLKKTFNGNATLQKLFSPSFLCSQIIKEEYDVVVSFLEGPSARIASAYNGKKIAWIHTEYDNKKATFDGFRSKKEAERCYNSFDKIVCVAQTVKNNLCKYLNITTSVQVIYNTNETDDILSKGKENQNVICKNDKCYNIISVGKLSFVPKGFDRLVSVHKRLLECGINNRLYILGEGADRSKLEQIIKDNKLSNSCFLLGFKKNPYKYVSNADLFVCSSYHEGFSTAVTEALVLGVPVVSTRVSGAEELLGASNEYGIVTENNEDALFDGVKTMLSKEGELERYKNQAIIRGKAFSKEKSVNDVEKLLENIICQV